MISATSGMRGKRNAKNDQELVGIEAHILSREREFLEKLRMRADIALNSPQISLQQNYSVQKSSVDTI